MKQKRIKLFLGGYANYVNAQNINCDNIAKYIDKEKFEVHLMYCRRFKFCKTQYPIDKKWYKEHDIHLHCLIMHRFFWYWSKLLVMILGNYDIYYLPKGEPMDKLFQRFFHNSQRVIITSVEGVIGGQVSENDIEYRQYCELSDGVFSISECIANSAMKYWNLKTTVLHLGVRNLDNKVKTKENLRTVIWVGSLIERKRPELVLQCAREIPSLQYYVVGGGPLLKMLQSQCIEQGIQNVIFTGNVENEQVYKYMQDCDLFLMTSEYEGLPKVIQEAAQSGLPSIYINRFYQVDFIENGINGYGVHDISEMIERIKSLMDDTEVMKMLSMNAHRIIQDYTWEKIIKKYEIYFEGFTNEEG